MGNASCSALPKRMERIVRHVHTIRTQTEAEGDGETRNTERETQEVEYRIHDLSPREQQLLTRLKTLQGSTILPGTYPISAVQRTDVDVIANLEFRLSSAITAAAAVLWFSPWRVLVQMISQDMIPGRDKKQETTANCCTINTMIEAF